MQQDSIYKTGNPARLGDTNSAGISAEASPFTNADVLAKALLNIKLILDIEKALADDLDFGNPRNSRPVQDQILTIIHEAYAVCTARRKHPDFRGRTVVSDLRPQC